VTQKLQSQVQLLNKALRQVEDVLAVYMTTVNKIARCIEVEE